MKYDRKAVGKHLQKVRKEAGFSSARAFAEYAGINTSTYTDFEQGNRPMSYERAWQLADALECSMDELGGRPWPPDGAAQAETPEERELVEGYRQCTPRQQLSIREVVGNYVDGGLAKNNQLSADDRKVMSA